VFRKFFTFRGDNNEAWQRAERFVSEEVRADVGGQLSLNGSKVSGTLNMNGLRADKGLYGAKAEFQWRKARRFARPAID
jgi:hypothetical protein